MCFLIIIFSFGDIKISFSFYQVDPSLIGGVIVTIGDKYIDMSIASKIKQYNAVLREIV